MPLTQKLWAVAATLAAPALRLMLRRRVRQGQEEGGRLAERFGRDTTPRPTGRLLWLHAASVGESLSALPMLLALPPSVSILFTTGTRTSAALLAARLAELGLAGRVTHRYVPLDVPAWAARFLDYWRPDAACFMESEIWPNLLAACRERTIPLALVNARLSPRAASGWSRVPGLARHLFSGFALVAARSEADAARLRALGADPVLCWGDLKTAADPLPADPGEVTRLSGLLAGRPRWLAASTHPADDAIVGAVHATLSPRYPGLLTVIVPRHPERGAALARRFAASRRALGEPAPAGGGIWVADTLGELGLLYRCCPIVLIGKGFASGPSAGGGQNPWEPAQLGCAVATGPATQNFEESVALLRRMGALQVVQDEDALAVWLDSMLSDPTAAARMGQAARSATRMAAGLPARLAERLVGLMDER